MASDTDEQTSPERQTGGENEKRQDDGENQPLSLRDSLTHFTWLYFSCTMSTGALAVVLNSTPNQFKGLQVIGKIFFIVDLVILTVFTMIMALRWAYHPRTIIASFHQPPEGLFFGTYWVSIALVLNCIQLYGVPACGPWLADAVHILFWIYVACVLLIAVLQYYAIFSGEAFAIEDAMPAWVFPVYPLLVIGPLAGNIITSQPQPNSWTMWVGAVMMQGLAWTLALTIYTMYTMRLLTTYLPSPENRPGMYVSVGPAGYTAAGLFSLGSLAPQVFPAEAFSVNSIPVGDVVKILGIMCGTFLILVSFWYFAISTIAVIAGIRKMSFTVNWWAFIFPNAGMTLAVIQLGKAYKSPAINGICSALTIMLVILWLIVAFAHIMMAARSWRTWLGKTKGTAKIT